MMYFGISNSKGHWEIKNIKSGDYLMQFAFLGFETAWRDISIPYEKGEIVLRDNRFYYCDLIARGTDVHPSLYSPSVPD
jgi:hypothetical protein